MPKKIGVLIVHGIGSQPAGYADGLIEELTERLAKRDLDGHFVFKAAYWGDVVNRREDDLFRDLRSTPAPMDWENLRRRLVINAFGDAVAYAGRFTQGSWAYDAIHRALARDLETLAELAGADDAPLAILSHSLGCQIVSNYLWDHQRRVEGRQFATTPFVRGDTLSLWITFGCNIPLFTLTIEEGDIEPVRFPGVLASAAFSRRPPKEVLKWTNFYDPDDILGFPLRGLPKYKDAVEEDIPIQTGTIFGAHTDYWTDNSFTVPVAERLAALAEYL